MTDYIPIDCSDYSEYELAILQRQQLRISWREPETGQAHVGTVIPVDLLTRNHEEFLITETRSGDTLAVRLDYILKSEVI